MHDGAWMVGARQRKELEVPAFFRLGLGETLWGKNGKETPTARASERAEPWFDWSL